MGQAAGTVYIDSVSMVDARTLVKATSVTVKSAGNATAINTDKGTLKMSANILPVEAGDKSVTWSVSDKTIASISPEGILKGTKNGKVIVTATTNDGSGKTGTYEVTMSNQTLWATSVSVSSANNVNAIDANMGTLQLTANILPAGASNKNVAWTINKGYAATISSTGLLTAKKNSVVVITATSVDGSGVSGTFELEISNQAVTDEEIIKNGKFNDALTSWDTYTQLPVGNPVVIENGAAKLEVLAGNPSAKWQSQIFQRNLEAQMNVPYTLTFKAWASKNRTMIIDFEDPNNGYHQYGLSKDPEATGGVAYWTINLTTEPKVYTLHVTFDGAQIQANSVQQITFYAGDITSTVFVDEVSLKGITTAINQFSSESSLQVYPNPVLGELRFSKIISEASVFNLLGQKVLTFSKLNSQKIDLSGLESGIYMISTTDMNGLQFTNKIVKQ